MSDTTTTTYVEYLHPGAFFPEHSVQAVTSRDPRQTAKTAPANVFAFRYFDRVRTVVEVDGEQVRAESGERNVSKTYYIDAELLGSDAVRALPGDHDILLANMENNGWDPIARCRTGNFQPFQQDEHELVFTR